MWELQKQGNIHTSDDVMTGDKRISRARRGISSTIARGHGRSNPQPTSEDLAEDLDELRRINGAGEANWARIFSALNDKIRHAADPALRRL